MSRITLTHEAIDMASVARLVEDARFGAVVTFAGNVRDNAHGQDVRFLEYECYEPLAHAELARIIAETESRWPVLCAITHRLGRVEIGECSVAVAVASPHRAEAFDACRWLMDTLKARVPLWKKEYAAGGAYWVEGPDTVSSPPTTGDA